MSDAYYVKCTECGSVNRFNNEKGDRPVCGKCKSRLDPARATSDKPVAVNDSVFASDVLGATVPVLVDFFATWCGACRSVEPTLEALASRHKGRLKVTKLDVDQNPTTSGRYQIRATPTLILFRGGQLAEKVVGAATEREIEDLLKKHMN